MSHSRKKNSHDEVSLFSFTEKVREGPKLSIKKKEGKENSTGHRSATKSKQAKQMKKQIKKKFIEAEVEKIMQQREFTSDSKLRDIKNVRTNDISGLREDLQSMKEVIAKLSFEERSNKSDEKKSVDEGQLQLICLGYRKKIGEIQEELEVQRQANAKLQEAHIQSQVFAQQTKDFSQSIKQELSELASKHIKCQQNIRDLEEARRKIREMSIRQSQLEEDLKRGKQNEDYLRSQNMRKSNEVSSLQQKLSQTDKSSQQWSTKCKEYEDRIAELKNTCEELQQQKETISYSLLQKIKEIHSSLQSTQSQNATLKKQNQSLLALIQHLRQQLEQQSSGRTCNTEEIEMMSHSEIGSNAGVNGLDSMERKCQELYEQIKREKYKWDLLNSESNQEKKHFEAEVGSLSQSCEALRKQLATKESSIVQCQRVIDQLKKEKVSLLRQLENSKNANIRLHLAEEEFKKKNVVLQSEKDDLLNSLKRLSEERNDVNFKIQELHQRIGLISEVLSQQKLANQFYSVELQRYDQQCKELNVELLSQRRKFQETDKIAKQSKTELSRAEQAYNALTEQFSQQKNHFQTSLSKMEAEVNEWKQIHSSLQSQLQAQKQSHLQTMQTLKQAQSKQQNLSLQVTRLSECTKRSQEQIQWYSKEVALKNKSIHELKQAIKLVKDESLLIKEEVEFYQQEYEEMNRLKEQMSNKNTEEVQKLTAMAMKQIEYMNGRIDDLQSDKVDLQDHLRRLGEDNEELSSKLKDMNPDKFVSKDQHQKTLMGYQQQQRTYLQEHKDQLRKIEEQRTLISSQLQQKSRQLQEKDRFIKWQEDLFNQRVTQLQAKFKQDTQYAEKQGNSQQLLKTISQKDEIIKSLTMKDSVNEQKRIKIVNEIHSIQNKIAELAERNNQLQQENTILNVANQRYEEKLAVMTRNVHVLEEQKQLLEDQSKLLHHQITQWKQRESTVTQKRQKQKQNLLQTCQQKLNTEITHLKNTIKDLANELTSNITKINSKNQEIQTLKMKYRQVQQILKENHEILSQQRSQREKLSHSNTQCVLAVQTHKMQISSKEKQIENLNKEKSIMQNKYADLSSKYDSLKLKYENIEHQRQIARKQIENQSVSLRVLREQNKNIQKVMSDQLNQRKAIIEQLVNEKRMLYSHLQHQ